MSGCEPSSDPTPQGEFVQNRRMTTSTAQATLLDTDPSASIAARAD